jgi:hypothetical protein
MLDDVSSEELTRRLTYAGFVLVGFELLKRMIVGPIKTFYADTTFHGGPFHSYSEDVLVRDSNEFEACLLYLRDFMEAIDSADMCTIQDLRKHRNELAHDLVSRLPTLQTDEYQALWEKVDCTLFKLSNHRTRMEVSADPEFQALGLDSEKIYGEEYFLFDQIVERVKVLNMKRYAA